jgi:two-component sensor histidine kinase
MPGATSLMRLVITNRTALAMTLPGKPASVRTSRRLARDLLAGCPRADDLALAITELATNAISHSASGQDGSFTVRVRTAPQWARIEVTDDGPGARPASVRNGWGLKLVASVTDRTGAAFGPGGQRTAWAEVTWPAPEE